ncbi:MAG: pirin family protein, partial [Pseudomonadales bacterium]|nr:pirin family protein [Pseudomonadales bacterium]
TVRRVLPSADQQMIGPFIFFDEMGPAVLAPDVAIDVRPHPHIGLATVTYLFEGEILHRDSLGYVQLIQPGAINLMTAGRGIVHSERSDEATLDQARPLHGIQCWMALPDGKEEVAPAFEHVPVDQMPIWRNGNVEVRVIMGSYGDITSPVKTHAKTLYLDVRAAANDCFNLKSPFDERGIYITKGIVSVGECRIESGTMAVLQPGDVDIQIHEEAQFMVLGGETIGPRHLWWNLVSSSKERIGQAKQDWVAGRFDSVPGDDEFIPLPDN